MKKSPWSFIPSLYLAEGFPYIVINVVSVAMYANMLFDNVQIAFWTGWLYLPWTLKMFWSPFVDGHGTKRKWLLGAQVVLSAIFLFLAAVACYHGFIDGIFNPVPTGTEPLAGPSFFHLTMLGFLLGAFVSATLDIATDGYYLLALSPVDQSKFVGIRTIFYRIAMILGSGVMLTVVGLLAPWILMKPLNWAALYLFFCVLFLAFALYHRAVLPLPADDKPVHSAHHSTWGEAFKTYFTQKNIAYILAFILLYRLGDAFLEKIVPLFLLKPTDTGALGLSLKDYGLIKGTLGLGAVIVGNLAGGWMLAKYGFKKCIWPFAAILILPNFFYAYMAWALPSLPVVALLITLEHLGNGLAMMAFSVFIMYISQGAFKTSHYAISTGIMALGMMFPSMASGWVQTQIGYKKFFLLASVISLITLAVVPLTNKIKSLEETERNFRNHKHSLEDAQS